jgi:hypothetical protein
MPGENATPRFYSLGDQVPFIFKFWLPAILMAGALAMCLPPAKPASVALGVVWGLLVLAVFWNTVLVKPEQDYLLYRRFFKWQRLEYTDIARCGRALFPIGLYYLKPRRFMPPLGKLYFVPYTPGYTGFGRTKVSRELLGYIRNRISQTAPSTPSPAFEIRPKAPPQTTREWMKLCLYSWLSGFGVVFAFALLAVYWQGVGFPPRIQSAPHSWTMFLYFSARVLSWPWNMIVLAGLVAGVLLLRFRRWALHLSWLAGLFVGGILGSLLPR